MTTARRSALFTFLILLSVLALWVVASAATRPRQKAEEPRVDARVEQLLQRVKELENRVAVLERRFLPLSDFQPDEHGILRDATGRVIGFWGVDGMDSERKRR
jgi:hypothetical protein